MHFCPFSDFSFLSFFFLFLFRRCTFFVCPAPIWCDFNTKKRNVATDQRNPIELKGESVNWTQKRNTKKEKKTHKKNFNDTNYNESQKNTGKA